MKDHNKQEQVQTEVPFQTLSEFLQSTPPNQWRHISDLSVPENIDDLSIRQINKPALELHCPHDSCNGIRFFRCNDVFSSTSADLEQNVFSHLYVSYHCSNCISTLKVYSLAAILTEIKQSRGICYKFGEFPPYGPPVPSRLIKLIGPDKDIFLKGRTCENQGLGIGAFTYYRRVVENQKNRILEEIIKVSEKIGVPQDKINTLYHFYLFISH